MKRSLFAELRRRNVLRAGAFYIAAVWAFGQGLSQFSPAIGLPDWATRWFLVAAALWGPFSLLRAYSNPPIKMSSYSNAPTSHASVRG